MGKRSKKVVFLSHCIINQNAKVLEFAWYAGVVSPIVDFLKRQGYAIEQLPCPETLYLGVKRWWHSKDLYDNPGFRKHCRALAKHVVDLMEHYIKKGFEIVLIGLDGSPSCGINLTGRNPYWGGRPQASIEQYQVVSGMGVWMEELLAEVEKRRIKLSKKTGIPMDMPSFHMETALKELDRYLKG